MSAAGGSRELRQAHCGRRSLDEANEGDLSFYGNPKYLKALRKSRATAVFVPHGFAEDVPAVRVWVDSPAEAFGKLLAVFAPVPINFEPGIHPAAGGRGRCRDRRNVTIQRLR